MEFARAGEAIRDRRRVGQRGSAGRSVHAGWHLRRLFFGPCTGHEAIKKMLAHFGDGGRNFRWEFFDPVAGRQRRLCQLPVQLRLKRPEAKGARVTFDGIGRFDLEGGRIRRYSEVFDGAWRWRSRSSSRSGCARSASSTPPRSRRTRVGGAREGGKVSDPEGLTRCRGQRSGDNGGRAGHLLRGKRANTLRTAIWRVAKCRSGLPTG